MNTPPLSIAVVGSGIAGLYCAHRLALRGHRVTVFEQLPHVGGRIETLHMAGIDCECGPMRFELALQPMLKQLANELGIQFSPFAPARGEPIHSTTYTLEADETPQEGTAASLDLLKLGIYRILHCPDPGRRTTPRWTRPSRVPQTFRDGRLPRSSRRAMRRASTPSRGMPTVSTTRITITSGPGTRLAAGSSTRWGCGTRSTMS